MAYQPISLPSVRAGKVSATAEQLNAWGPDVAQNPCWMINQASSAAEFYKLKQTYYEALQGQGAFANTNASFNLAMHLDTPELRLDDYKFYAALAACDLAPHYPYATQKLEPPKNFAKAGLNCTRDELTEFASHPWTDPCWLLDSVNTVEQYREKRQALLLWIATKGVFGEDNWRKYIATAIVGPSTLHAAKGTCAEIRALARAEEIKGKVAEAETLAEKNAADAAAAALAAKNAKERAEFEAFRAVRAREEEARARKDAALAIEARRVAALSRANTGRGYVPGLRAPNLVATAQTDKTEDSTVAPVTEGGFFSSAFFGVVVGVVAGVIFIVRGGK